MKTIRSTFALKLQRAKKYSIICYVFMGIGLLLYLCENLFYFLQEAGFSCLLIGLSFCLYSRFLVFWGMRCPNCKKSLGSHITCKSTQYHLVRSFPKKFDTFAISRANLKECSYCNIDLDTPMNKVEGVELIAPTYKSFHVYREEKPYIKVEKENKK